jgi:hypothetical protein
MSHVYSTEWRFQFDPNFLQVKECALGQENSQTALAWAAQGGRLTIATASLKDAGNGADFIHLVVQMKKGLDVNPLKVLKFSSLKLNEGLLKADFEEADNSGVPNNFLLLKIYPNPFVARTTIVISVPGLEQNTTPVVRLSIYNVLGQKVRDILETKALLPGLYSFNWNGLDNEQKPVGNGVYFCRLQIANQAKVQKMIYMRR